MFQTALISGGSRGIGLATAFSLLKRKKDLSLLSAVPSSNSTIVLCSRSDTALQSAKQQLDSWIDSNGRRLNQSFSISTYQCDVSDSENVKQMCKDVLKTYHSVDLLVNCAGIAKNSLLLQMPDANIDSVINTNLMGTIHTCKWISKSMVAQRKGCIINVSSVIGINGNAGQSVYSASKAGVIGLTKSLAKELGSRGIRANCIAPGYVETDMTSGIPESQKAKLIERTALQHFGSPEDIGQAAVYLSEAKFVTGHCLVVDGGLLI